LAVKFERIDNRRAWADAIAADMATVFESAAEDYFDQQLGIRLRNAIYAMGACAI
jgi:Zn-dependent oligopeptidase